MSKNFKNSYMIPYKESVKYFFWYFYLSNKKSKIIESTAIKDLVTTMYKNPIYLLYDIDFSFVFKFLIKLAINYSFIFVK